VANAVKNAAMMTATPKLTMNCAGLIGAGLPSGGTDMP
jgi:hypothetical protein